MAKESQSRASRHDSKKAAAAYKGPKQKKSRKENERLAVFLLPYLYGALLFRMSRSLIRGWDFFGGTLKMHHH